MSEQVLIVIPARSGSTRFPNKPKAQIASRTMLERVWRIGRASEIPTIITTDSKDIQRHAESFGATAVLTSEACRNGTERIAEYVRSLPEAPSIVINLQGDSPLIPPRIINDLVAAMRADASVSFGTVAVPIPWSEVEALKREKGGEGSRGTLVVVNRAGNALYFSKQMIPYCRTNPADGSSPYLRHLGLYGYRAPFLQTLCALSPTPLEECEGLEQLRALEHGYPIRVVTSDLAGRRLWSVDRPEDVAIVEAILREQGDVA